MIFACGDLCMLLLFFTPSIWAPDSGQSSFSELLVQIHFLIVIENMIFAFGDICMLSMFFLHLRFEFLILARPRCIDEFIS
jgi:hypothetical protein